MAKTENYGINLWELDDYMLLSEFNANFSSLDEALHKVEQSVQGTLGNVATKDDIPNVSSFITNTVSSLLNYYTKTEVEQMLAEFNTLADLFKPVSTLPIEPEEGDENRIFVVPAPDGEEEDQNKRLEYIWVDGEWELFGAVYANVDLRDYWDKETTQGKLDEITDQVQDLIANGLTLTAEQLLTITGNLTSEQLVAIAQSIALTDSQLEQLANTLELTDEQLQTVVGGIKLSGDNLAELASKLTVVQLATIAESISLTADQVSAIAQEVEFTEVQLATLASTLTTAQLVTVVGALSEEQLLALASNLTTTQLEAIATAVDLTSEQILALASNLTESQISEIANSLSADQLEAMTPELVVGTVTKLAPTAQPTVVIKDGKIDFGIVQGETGDTGAMPTLAVGTVSTLAYSEQVTVAIDPSSTAENVILNIGIPVGVPYDAPVESVDVTLTSIGKLTLQKLPASNIVIASYSDNPTSAVSGGTVMGTLPSGFIPREDGVMVMSSNGATGGTGSIIFGANGSIVRNGELSTTKFHGLIVYIAKGV